VKEKKDEMHFDYYIILSGGVYCIHSNKRVETKEQGSLELLGPVGDYQQRAQASREQADLREPAD